MRESFRSGVKWVVVKRASGISYATLLCCVVLCACTEIYLRAGLLAPGAPVSMLPVSSATRALILATRDSMARIVLAKRNIRG